MMQQNSERILNVLIVIPCFNEEEAIADVVREVESQSVPNVNISVLVVNDQSNDDSLSVLKSEEINHVTLPVNLGIGGAVQTGFKYALKNGFDVAIQVDGDGQHPAEELGKLITPIANNEADVVIGSRYLTKKGFQSSSLRRFGINFFRTNFKSPTKATSTGTFLFISDGSISIWIFFESKEYVFVLPVTLSSNLIPQAINKSAF